MIFRTVLMYIMVFAVMRIMGKREIGQLSIFDLVISIMVAEIAVLVLEDSKRPLYDGIVPMLTLLLIQIGIAVLSLRYRKLRLWFDGKPSVIIRDGNIDQEEMKKQRYNMDDLLMQLRSQKVDSVGDVEFAVLETSGQLSVFPKEKSGAPKGDAKEMRRREAPFSSVVSKVRYEPLPLPLIVDGKVEDNNLKQIGKTRFWLKNQIQAKGVGDFKDIFFCSIDHKGKLYIIPKKIK
ncbi:YetF domain-containing protein [Paenibacillus haidiansis]